MAIGAVWMNSEEQTMARVCDKNKQTMKNLGSSPKNSHFFD